MFVRGNDSAPIANQPETQFRQGTLGACSRHLPRRVSRLHRSPLLPVGRGKQRRGRERRELAVGKLVSPFGANFESSSRPTDRFRGSENGCSLSHSPGMRAPDRSSAARDPRAAAARSQPRRAGMSSSSWPASSTTSRSRRSRRCATGATTPTRPAANAARRQRQELGARRREGSTTMSSPEAPG